MFKIFDIIYKEYTIDQYHYSNNLVDVFSYSEVNDSLGV